MQKILDTSQYNDYNTILYFISDSFYTFMGFLYIASLLVFAFSIIGVFFGLYVLYDSMKNLTEDKGNIIFFLEIIQLLVGIFILATSFSLLTTLLQF